MENAQRSALDRLLNSSKVKSSVRRNPDAPNDVLSLTEQVTSGFNHPVGSYEFLLSTVDVYDAAQADSAKSGKVDLTAELSSLVSTPVLADFINVLLGPNPDRKVLKALGTPFASKTRFERSGAQSETVLQLRPGMHYVPNIGEDVGTYEVLRELHITCRYAKWRDRKVRRLARIRIVSTFAFAVPSTWMPLE